MYESSRHVKNYIKTRKNGDIEVYSACFITPFLTRLDLNTIVTSRWVILHQVFYSVWSFKKIYR